jgi:2'-5' RNA ligase
MSPWSASDAETMTGWSVDAELNDNRQTIGVAIPIPHPYGDDLQAWRRSFGDRMADAIPSHITLLPPTPIERSERPAIEKHLVEAARSREPFVVHLRGTGTFRPVSPVVFVALARGISDCETLATAVRTGPLPVELRFPYHPHVTVAHHLSDEAMDYAFAALADYEADFLVESFGLYEHGSDGVWRKHSDFPLGEGEATTATGRESA